MLRSIYKSSIKSICGTGVTHTRRLLTVGLHCCVVGMRKMHRNVVLTVLCAVVVILLLFNLQMNWKQPDPRPESIVRVYNTRTGESKIERVDSKEILDDAAESYEDTDEIPTLENPKEYLTAGSFDYAQYKIVRGSSMNRDSIQYINLRSQKMRVNATHDPRELKFTVFLQKKTPEKTVLSVIVKNKYGVAVPGCSFQTRQYFGDGYSQMALCSTTGYKGEIYTITCLKYGSKCANILIHYRFGFYDQFQDEPRIFPHNHLIYNKTECRTESKDIGASNPATVTWSVFPNKTCDTLKLNNKPVRKFTADETCACVRKFDEVYLIGTSHIRFFADYLLSKCHGQTFEGVEHNHLDLEKGNVHYLAWVFVEQLHFQIQMTLQKWLDPHLFGLAEEKAKKRRIAVWIQTGSWDFSKISYNFTMEHAFEQFDDTLRYIQSLIAKSDTEVDLRVISTTPMTDKWYRNNFAIGAFNVKQKEMLEKLKIDFTDIFTMELPCKDFLEGNHYFYRVNETFGGNVGESVYFGHFLPKVCSNLT